MDDFGDTTGLQNPIFKIMNNQNPQMNQNKIPPNQMGINQIGMQGELNNPMKNQNMNMGMMENNQMNIPMNPMNPNIQNPMGQNNEMKNNINMMNNNEQNEHNINQGMNIGMGGMNPGMNPMMGNPNMNNNFMQLQMMQQQMFFQMNSLEQMKAKPDFKKIKENLSKLLGDGMNFLIDKIYYDINGRIMQLKKPNSYYPFNITKMIKINFYDTILEIKFYENTYISWLIEYIFDEIFGEIQEQIFFGERKNENQTTEEIITKPRREIRKIRVNDYYRYLFLEYKGRDLNELKYKTCKEVGLENNSELLLKFIESNSDEKNEIYVNNIKEKIVEPKNFINDKKNENHNDNIKYKKNISKKSNNYENHYNSINSLIFNVRLKIYKILKFAM